MIANEDAHSLTPVDKVVCLQKLDVFKHATTEMLAYIGSIAHEITVSEGQVIFSEEDVSDAMYVVVKGHVRLDKQGKEVVSVSESNSFGTWALFDSQPRLMTAIAVEDSHLLKIRSEDFYDLLSDHDEITPAIFGAIVERVKSLVTDNGADRQDETRTDLNQSDKMASLGLLVAGLTHELNTPMGAIHSNNDIMRKAVSKLRKLPEVKESKELLRILEIMDEVTCNNSTATERITSLIRNLKNFARLDEAERKAVNIHEGLESTLSLLQHKLKNRIRVIKRYADLPEIECFPNQLNQVFMNLLVNAAQSIKDRGTITIATFRDDDSIKIAISDNGVGIPEENLTKIFDPGFTTKGSGIGTGLGLSICYQIVQDHKGRIEVESSGKGSTFTIVLPLEGFK